MRHSLIAATLAVAATASAQHPSVEIPGSGVNLVRLDVVALDSDGRPIGDLVAEDFEVVEDGQPQSIVSFEAITVRQAAGRSPTAGMTEARWTETRETPRPEDGRQLMVFFDDVHISSAVAEQVRRALAAHIASQLRNGDWIAIIAPQNGLWWAARTPSEHHFLAEVVPRLSGTLVRDPFYGSLSEWEAMQVVEFGRSPLRSPVQSGPMPGRRPSPAAQIGSSPLEVYSLAQRRIRKTLRTLAEAIEALVDLRGRKALVMITEGFIRSPGLSREYDRVIDIARRAHVSVYFIDPRGLASGRPGAEADSSSDSTYRPPAVMREGQVAGAAYLSLATGGREFFSNEILRGVGQALDESSVYYLLGFEPPTAREGEHRIRVRVLREGVRVQARDRYFLEALDEPDSPVERAVRAIPDEDDLPLRVSTAVSDLSGKKADIVLFVEVGGEGEPGGSRRLEATIDARRADGRRVEFEADPVTVPSSGAFKLTGLRLPQGLWQIRLVVRDQQSSAIGSVLHTCRVP